MNLKSLIRLLWVMCMLYWMIHFVGCNTEPIKVSIPTTVKVSSDINAQVGNVNPNNQKPIVGDAGRDIWQFTLNGSGWIVVAAILSTAIVIEVLGKRKERKRAVEVGKHDKRGV